MNQAEQREEAVFEAALQLPADQRARYLDKTCAGDADLRRRVEVLLGAFERAGGFMKQPAAPEPTGRFSGPPIEKPGDKIGRYKLLEQIGEGGCGVVYVAEQEEPVRRRVALKVIKLGMDTKQVIARFDAERQALAMMDHPNIAKIFDAGITETAVPEGRARHSVRAEPQPFDSGARGTDAPYLSPGRPYFVMELVRGIKITDYCDQNHLPPRERLDLFIQVCRAIQHAHQKGIIHRDIKPSNILVTLHDGVPVPKVIDFGIAKATQGRLTDQTVYTAFEQFIGTPAYMSPEQAELSGLDIDTRSDIYSLGVLLYELLTGKTPFDAKELLAAGLDEMRRTIREVEPVKPSTRLTQELQRLGSARVSRAESDASSDSRSSNQKSFEESQSHEVFGGATKTARGARALPKSAIPSDLDWIVMKCLEKDRTRRYETANGLAMDLQRHLSNEPVVAAAPSAAYRAQKFIRRNKAVLAVAVSMVLLLLAGTIVSTWQAVRATRAQKVAQTEATKSRQVARFLEDMLEGVGPSVALGSDTSLLREILAKTAERVGKDLTNQPRVEMELRGTIGRAYQALADYPKAEDMLSEAVRLCRKLPGNNDLQLASLLADLGMVFWREGKFADAKASASEAVTLCRNLTGEESRRELAVALNSLATVQFEFGRRDAEAMLREAVDIQKTLLDKSDPALLTTLGNLASVLPPERRLTEGEKILREVVAVEETLPGEGLNLAIHLNSLGLILRDKGDLAQAETTLRRALELRRKLYPKGHAELAQSVANLARVLTIKGDLEGAEEYLQEALAMRRKIFPDGSPELWQNLTYLGNLLQKKGRLAGAEAAHREALAMRRTMFGDDNKLAATSLENLGSVLEAEGKLDVARTLYTELVSGSSAIAAAAQFRLADLYRTGRGVPANRAEAVKWFRQSADLGNRAAEFMLGQAYAQGSGVAKDIDEAARWYRKAAEHGHHYAQNALGTAHAQGLGVPKNEAEAVRWYRESADQGNPHAAGNLARMYASGRGVPEDASEAAKWYRKAADGNPDGGASLSLARIYASGKGVPKDVSEAKKWYRAAAERWRAAAADGKPQSLNAIAWFLATCENPEVRDGKGAIIYAEKAVEATQRQDPGILDTLAAAYAEAGRFAEAVKTQQEAISLAQDERTQKDLASRLELYESNTPYHESY